MNQKTEGKPAKIIGSGGDDLNNFDFTRSQAVGGVQFADFLIKRQRFGRVGQYADEVGDEAVVFQRGFDAGFLLLRERFRRCVRLSVPYWFPFYLRFVKRWGHSRETNPKVERLDNYFDKTNSYKRPRN